jgi:glycosyltransferase involved in cell wall biosynthesis
MDQAALQPAVTIAITRYAEPDRIIADSLRHALGQQGVSGEVLFIEQDTGSKLGEAEFAGGNLELRIIRQRLPGLSAARNLALDEARHPLVLFLDADALAEPDWAFELAQVLAGERIAVAGSKVVPRWPGETPFFARASALRDQYSLIDLGEGTQPYHRVVGAGFGADMGKLPAGFRFDTALGRRGGLLFGGEESDFCSRARQLGFEVVYVGRASVTHLIEPERCRWGWILKRMVFAGHGRARQGGAPSASGKAGFYDWLLLPAYLPPYALGWLWGKLSR